MEMRDCITNKRVSTQSPVEVFGKLGCNEENKKPKCSPVLVLSKNKVIYKNRLIWEKNAQLSYTNLWCATVSAPRGSQCTRRQDNKFTHSPTFACTAEPYGFGV